MSILIECPHCGIVIGEIANVDDFGQSQRLVNAVLTEIKRTIFDCSGHKVTVKETSELFGLIKQTAVTYHETDTYSLSLEYLGPANKFWLWFALLFAGGDGIMVNGEWAWWDFKTGFFGPGVEELANLKPKSA